MATELLLYAAGLQRLLSLYSRARFTPHSACISARWLTNCALRRQAADGFPLLVRLLDTSAGRRATVAPATAALAVLARNNPRNRHAFV